MNRRTYNVLQMLESDGSLREMKSFENDDRCPLVFPDLKKNKSTWDIEELIGPTGKPGVFPTDANC